MRRAKDVSETGNRFRENSRYWRLRKGLTDKAVCTCLGRSESYINSYERYTLLELTPETKQRYAEILGVPLDDLLNKEPISAPVHLTDIDQGVLRHNLEQIWARHKLTVNQFADRLAIPTTDYQNYIKSRPISIWTFWHMIDALDVDPWLLATGKTHKEG